MKTKLYLGLVRATVLAPLFLVKISEMKRFLIFFSLMVVVGLGFGWRQLRQNYTAIQQMIVPAPTPSEAVDQSSVVEPERISHQLWQNPGFESGKEPWFSMASWGTEFDLSSQLVHSGKHSAVLNLDSNREVESETGESRVYGVVQEFSPLTFPQRLSGYYYVKDWQKNTQKMYLQVVVIVIPKSGLQDNYQIRYLLAGAETQPIEIKNAQFEFVTKAEPKLNEWVPFQMKLREDFTRLWEKDLNDIDKLRVFFEVRFDKPRAQESPSRAQVYYDDLVVEN